MSDNINTDFPVTLTFDQIPEFERRTGLKWNSNTKLCDFCDKNLSNDHESKKCILCPTIFDRCDDCTSKSNKVVCHKSHDVEQSGSNYDKSSIKAYEERSSREIDQVIRQMTEIKLDDVKWLKDIGVWMYGYGKQHIDVSELFKKFKDNESEALHCLGKLATDGFPIIASHKDSIFSLAIYKRILS